MDAVGRAKDQKKREKVKQYLKDLCKKSNYSDELFERKGELSPGGRYINASSSRLG